MKKTAIALALTIAATLAHAGDFSPIDPPNLNCPEALNERGKAKEIVNFAIVVNREFQRIYGRNATKEELGSVRLSMMRENHCYQTLANIQKSIFGTKSGDYKSGKGEGQ